MVEDDININEEWKLSCSDVRYFPSPLQAKSISMDGSALINRRDKTALSAGTLLHDLWYDKLVRGHCAALG